MKTITVIAILFCFGCASPPARPNDFQMVMDIMAGRGMTADQINQTYTDYEKAKAEYENSASYKLKILAVTPLLLLGAATADMPYCSGYRGSRYGCGVPSKAIVTTNPTAGGGTSSTIKWYK